MLIGPVVYILVEGRKAGILIGPVGYILAEGIKTRILIGPVGYRPKSKDTSSSR